MLLLVGMSLVLAASSVGLGRSKDSDSSLFVLRRDAAVEAAARLALARVASGGARTLVQGASTLRLEIDGFKVDVRVQAADGLIGMRSAEPALLEDTVVKVLRLSSIAADKLVARMRHARTYAELLSADGLHGQELACLLSYVTLYSQRSRPVLELAPETVRGVLGRSEEPRSEINDEGAVSNLAVVRVLAAATNEGARGRTLFVEGLVMPQSPIPLRVLEWYWLSRTKNDGREGHIFCSGE